MNRFDGDPLRIWRTPMKWLAAGREGLVIVRRKAAFYGVGAGVIERGDAMIGSAHVRS